MDYIILPAPQAVFGISAVIFLALIVFKIHNINLNRAILAAAVLIAVYASAITYFYSADNEAFLSGLVAKRAGLLSFCGAAFMVLFSLRREKFGEYFFLNVSSIMFIFAVSLYSGSVPAQAAGFFAVDIFAVLFKKKEIEQAETAVLDAFSNKLMHFIIAVAFMLLFLLCPQNLKLQKLAFTGMIFMLLLSMISGYFTTTARELPKFKQAYLPAGLLPNIIPVIAQFAILSAMISQNQNLLLGKFMTIVVIVLLLLAAFKSVTEEKHSLFALRDVYILFYLGILGISCANLTQGQIAVFSVLFVLNTDFSMEAFNGPNSAKLTMSGVKYSFEKIQGNSNIFMAVILGLCAEGYMILSIYKNITGDPLIHAAVLIGLALYSPALLNKIFTLFSMIKRIKVESGFKQALNAGSLIMILFSGMAAAMLYKW